ncbi:N-acetyltransferase [Vagococcus sp. CY53-2]|uniref:GNAT family N-acetyltransferase n=1 Tax=Vagococcus sp. CY53-2 TaxID=2925780 RepID=UPI001F511163|nr:N-acetyltransferase [Vagococcus sp. CY53-2]MCI0129669.1 N-acetyltransferase [Vagococcus sp. CY53-2]
MKLRTIQTEDDKHVKEVITKAFEQSDHGHNGEATLVETIRELPTYNQELEVVALVDSDIVGHGLLSEAVVKNDTNDLKGLVLAPLSVVPDYQNQGIGSHVLLELEKRAKETEHTFITILGDPSFYSRFGYVSAKNSHVRIPLDVPSEYLLMKKLKPEMTEGISFYNRIFGS